MFTYHVIIIFYLIMIISLQLERGLIVDLSQHMYLHHQVKSYTNPGMSLRNPHAVVYWGDEGKGGASPHPEYTLYM